MPYKLCAVIPTFNHYKTLPPILSTLMRHDIPVYLIDDGSDGKVAKFIDQIVKGNKGVVLFRLPKNLGKGAAVSKGLEMAASDGYTHAFQVDADGQHDLSNLKGFIETSEKNPSCLVSGLPVYDQSIPKSRKIGRWFTHVWIWIETLSLQIKDSMCGFRIYPIEKTMPLMKKVCMGKRMTFDPEIIVRLFWEGVPTLHLPVRVTYPKGNTSNFKLLRDNWQITKMHTYLFFGMLFKFPKMIRNRCTRGKEEKHWARLRERGPIFGIKILFSIYKVFGRRMCIIFGVPVILYYYLTSPLQRGSSREFLARVASARKSPNSPNLLNSFKHFMSFYEMYLDKISAWAGEVDMSMVEKKSFQNMEVLLKKEKGGVFFVSHLGNIEFCRAVYSTNCEREFHVLIHMENAMRYNAFLQKMAPSAHINLIEVSQIGPDTIIFLRERIEKGDWVFIAADRIPVSDKKSVLLIPFLGKEAFFPQGPYILASLLECPVYTFFAVRGKDKISLNVDKFSDQLILPRKERKEVLRVYAQKYAKILEEMCLKYPYQWYNFYPYWNQNLDEIENEKN